MTALRPLLIEHIRQQGPLRLDAYMAQALGHPSHGYYMTRDPFGVRGDFTTAPETSQLFGEAIALHLYEAWERMGSPKKLALIEAGPGRGTLMADVVRILHRLFQLQGQPLPFMITLIETSPLLRQKQQTLLAGLPIHWAEQLVMPETPVLFLANELLDALPVRQFRFLQGGWKERHVTVAEDTLEWQDSACDAPPFAPSAIEGMVYEYCPEAYHLLHKLTAHAACYPLSALMIDYGYEAGEGDTLQALHHHTYVHPLGNPGEADITCHVDFGRLQQAARDAGIPHSYLMPQGRFLRQLGIEQRLAQVTAKATAEQKDSLTQSYWRLTSPDAMGVLFKAWCVESRHFSTPPSAFRIDDTGQVR